MPRLETQVNTRAPTKTRPNSRCRVVPFGVMITQPPLASATTQAAVCSQPSTDIDRSIDSSALDESYTLQCRVFCQYQSSTFRHDPLDDVAQIAEVVGIGAPAGCGDQRLGARPLAHEVLLDGHVAGL